MPLCNMKDLLENAEKGNYAVGSFSIANMEMILGVIKAAEETRSPIILQIAEVRLNHSPLHIIGPAMLAAAKRATVPVAVHLDHGTSLECIGQALRLGFTSVMFDGSHLTFEKNVDCVFTVKGTIVRYTHKGQVRYALRVKANEEISVVVNTYDPDNPDAHPVGVVDFTVEFS